MGRIQSNIGLITGIPIGDTVDALMALAARPRDLLFTQTTYLQQEQLAITNLSALLVSISYIAKNLGKPELFDQRTVTSSDPDVLSATLTGDPPKGTYQFTPLQTVQSHQLLSNGVADDEASLGGGKLTFRFGDHVQRSAQLNLFGDGQGVVRGKIRITDRSGQSAEIDLSTARTVEDVLEAINDASGVNVTAVAHGDGIRLIDNTGQSVSNLKVAEVGGSTAASLGLGGIDVAGDVADGQDMLRLYEGLDVDALNDGSGLQANVGLPEIEYTLRDGTVGQLDFSEILTGTSNVAEQSTLGDVLDLINAAEPGKLQAEIAPDGDRLLVTDLTAGTEAFTLTALNDLTTLADLGLDGPSVDGVITGRRIMAGTGTVLLSSLDGGRGLGELGTLQLTDRSGASGSVDLSGAETLEEVIDAINAAGVGILARVDRAQYGIELTDTTGASAANLVVANGDATDTADKLGIAIDDAVDSTGSGDLHLQIIAYNTRLTDLNGGGGVAKGTFTIVDSWGQDVTIDLRSSDVETVGDVIRAINNSPQVDVLAGLNETGDGILIQDSGDGPLTLHVDEGTTTTAADLHLLGDAVKVDVEGVPTQKIDGSTTFVIDLDDGDFQIDAGTALADLNGGDGVAPGTFSITDSAAAAGTIDLSTGTIQTVGELIDAINALSVEVEARINDTNNGILLIDRAGGDDVLQVWEGNSTTAADLHLLRDAEETDVGEDDPVQAIDGVMISGVSSMADLHAAINSLGAGVTASTFIDGSSNPYRLSLISDRAGTAGRLVVDTSQLDLSLAETVSASDALLVFGDIDSPAANVLVSSSTNTFRDVLSGVTLNIKQASTTPVTITVGTTDTDLVANVQTMVNNYNSFRNGLLDLTEYDLEAGTASVLSGDATALRLDVDLSYMLSGRFNAGGAIQSLAEIGVDINEDGTLSFDESTLKARHADDPQAVQQFFLADEIGFSAKFEGLIDRLSDDQDSLLASRLEVLSEQIERNAERIEFMETRLEVQREQLLMQFYRMEMAIGKMQSSLAALQAFTPLAPMTSAPSVSRT